MSENKTTIQDSNLIIGDRLNFPYIIGLALIQYINCRNKPDKEFSPEQVKESALAVSKLIPPEMEDKKYKEDVESSYTLMKADQRDYWCGHRVGDKPIWKIFKKLDPARLIQSVMSLLHRRKMLGRSIPQELMDQFDDKA